VTIKRTHARSGESNDVPYHCIECDVPDRHCVITTGCDPGPRSGYWIYSDEMGQAFFVCDECLKNARKQGAYSAKRDATP
jgi:hypothetical protein